jgi:hypothetical protein
MSVEFDGSTYLSGANMRAVASQKFTFYTWIKPSDLTTHNGIIQCKPAAVGNSRFYFLLRSTGELQCVGYNSGGSVILSTISTDASIVVDTWYCIVMSVDLSSATVDLYLNGTALTLNTTQASDDSIDFTPQLWRIGTYLNPADGDPLIYPYYGVMDEIYFYTDYIDLSVDLNERRFYGNTGLYSTSGTKVGLGPGGRTPFGRQPNIFLTHGPGNFGRNDGTGDNFTITGTLTTDYGRAPNVESLARGFKGQEWRESERSGIPFADSELVIEPATGVEVHRRREYSTDRDEINRNRRYGRRRFEY